MFELAISNKLVTWILSVTGISTIVIVIFFLLFLREEFRLYWIQREIKKLLEKNNILDSIKKTKIAPLGENYSKTINITTDNGLKSNIPASEFINDNSVCKCKKLNLRMLDSASGILVGLGLFGTFLGLTLGITGIDITNADTIKIGIQGLLEGMKTAFITSLVGMLASIIFTLIDKRWRNHLYKHVYSLTEKLDSLYYIDDLAVACINQQKIVNQLYNVLKADIQEQTSLIVDKLTYNNPEGQDVTIGNAIREILTENTKQSTALMSFSTDLAMELNQGFDEVLSRQMQERIVPLMESVDATTRAVIEHIDKMAETVSSPATDMMQNVVNELRQSMQSIIGEFTAGLSGSATSQLENLATQLGTATQAMADFPENMRNISATLNGTIEEMRHAISDISHTTAQANATAMQQMQEQSNQMLSKLAEAAERMGTFLTGTVSTLSTSVQQSVQHITDNINNNQADLIALQEDTITQTRQLLENFNTSLERLKGMNENITTTMQLITQAQGNITITTSNLHTISSNMKLATESFNKGQRDYAAKLAELQTKSQQSIDQVTELLRKSGQLSDEYVQKFNVIKQGLTSIFTQLQNGLTDYSRTVNATMDSYLSHYGATFQEATSALASAIQQLNEITEMLTDTITRNRR